MVDSPSPLPAPRVNANLNANANVDLNANMDEGSELGTDSGARIRVSSSATAPEGRGRGVSSSRASAQPASRSEPTHQQQSQYQYQHPPQNQHYHQRQRQRQTPLERKLGAALASRAERGILRRLPELPSSASSSFTASPLPRAFACTTLPSSLTSSSEGSSALHHISNSTSSTTTSTATANSDGQEQEGQEEELVDFTSNDYLSLSSSPLLRELFLERLTSRSTPTSSSPSLSSSSPSPSCTRAPQRILGSSGSRLLLPVPHQRAHLALERRLGAFFGDLSRCPHDLGSRTHPSSLEGPLFSHELEALLFNSGYDANAGFWGCVPQVGDVVVCDELVHASVWEGVGVSRVGGGGGAGAGGGGGGGGGGGVRKFRHNDLSSLRTVLEGVRDELGRRTRMRMSGSSGENGTSGLSGSSTNGTNASSGTIGKDGHTVFVAIESVYSMDGTVAPLREMVRLLEGVFPGSGYASGYEEGYEEGSVGGVDVKSQSSAGVDITAYLVIDEAHATGMYGPGGRGCVADVLTSEEVDRWVLARLCTFGKALGVGGAVILTSRLVKEYLVNYARPFIYTTALPNVNVIAVDCVFDLMEGGVCEELAGKLLDLSHYFISTLQSRLDERKIPASVVSLPSHLSCFTSPPPPPSPSPSPTPSKPPPIIPLLTPHPHALSSHLLSLGINARPITWPTVPKGKERVRICMHAGNTRDEVGRLVGGVVGWGEGVVGGMKKAREGRDGEGEGVDEVGEGVGEGGGGYERGWGTREGEGSSRTSIGMGMRVHASGKGNVESKL